MRALTSLLMCVAVGLGVIGCTRGEESDGRSQVEVEMRQIAQTVVVWVNDHHRIPGTRTVEVVKAITSRDGRSWYEHDPARLKEGLLLDPWGEPYLILVSEDGVCVASSGGSKNVDTDHLMVVFVSFEKFNMTFARKTDAEPGATDNPDDAQ